MILFSFWQLEGQDCRTREGFSSVFGQQSESPGSHAYALSFLKLGPAA